MEAPGAAPQWYLGQVLDMLCRVVAALPEDLRKGSNPYGVPWELLICAAIVGFFAVFLFLWRSFRSIRSRLYVEREKKLAVELSTLIEEKCELLEKCSLVQKEYEGLESITESNFEESTEAQSSETICEKLDSSKSELEDEILSLEEELKEEKSKHSEQDELMEDISNRIQSLQDESKSLKSQLAEAKTTFKIFQMNEERLKIAVKDALNENSQLQESQKQLLLEAEESKEKMNELNEQKVTFEDSILYTKQDICDKENQIKSLTERLLKMQDWAAVLGEDFMDDNLKLEMKSDAENGALLDNQPKGALKSLVHAAKLKASLKTLEGERNQIYIQLTEVDKTKEELGEFIKNLQAEQASLQSESEQLDSENQKLQHKLKVMTELFQENEMMLHRKLTVEENYRLEKEEKLSKADERISHAAEELETYRKRAKDLEEELDRTVHSYQGQILSHEKKAHDNWLAARTAERNLNDLKKENSYLRQKLTETELKFELLEKDPYALDVPNTAFGREHSPYGPSPLGRPSSETRAFLSPPTLLEGPLRLSPLLPGGGGRGSRGPGNPQDHQVTNERGVSSCDKLTDSHREPSDTGSLSPPREQDPRMMIPSLGHPYPDSAILPQRQDRFYSNTGRLSGPAELRSFKMPSLDKADGPESSEVEPNRNDSQDDLGNLHVPDESLPAKSEATGPGFAPPARGPFFPVDARGPFIRRGPPFPPSPGSMYGAPRDYFPPDPAIPLQRQDRFYSNTGRLSGPAELRSFKMPSPDKADGPESSEVEPNRNDSQDDLGNLHVPDESLPAKSEATGPGFAPPARGPFFPVDARGPFIRRGPPFPPSPGSMYGVPRDYFPPGNFPGPPPPPFAMRNVFPPRVFPHYTPPRSGFFPSPPHPEKRSEVPSVLTPPSNEPTTDERPEP